jgi:hypothetical protein
MKTSSYRVLSFLSLFPLSLGCSSLLGITDISTEENPDNLGGETSSGGTSVPSGGSEAGGSSSGGKGSGGKSSGGGSSTGGDASGGQAAGGSASGGGSAGGSDTGGQGSGGGTALSGVSGRLIDFWRRPVPNVTIKIPGVATTSKTDADGNFSIEDVPATYDIEFLVTPDGMTFRWLYTGLTRRDPTIQVMEAFPDQSAYYAVTATNYAAPDDPSGDTLTYGFDSPVLISSNLYNETYFYLDAGSTQDGENYTAHWLAPDPSRQTNAYGLQWNAEDDFDTPPVYKGLSVASAIDLAAGSPSFAFDSWTAPTGTGTVSGTLGNTSGFWAQLFLVLPGFTRLRILDDSMSGSTFQREVPLFGKGERFLAVAGDWGYYSLGLAYKTVDVVASADSPVSLDLPSPPVAISPSSGAGGVATTDTFSWQPGSNSPCSLLQINHLDDNDLRAGAFRIVTCNSEATIPASFSPPKGVNYVWWVTSHGAFTSVDEMTGEGGFMDSFGRTDWQPDLPDMEEGVYSRSEYSDFSMGL